MSSLLPRVQQSRLPLMANVRRHASVRRVGLVGSVALATLLSWQVAGHQGHMRVEPELLLLLRGMAVIKGCLALLALTLVVWRLGRPVTIRATLAYAACLWLMVTSTFFIWFQVSVSGAAVLFHAGELALLLVAWREGFPVPRFGRQEC